MPPADPMQPAKGESNSNKDAARTPTLDVEKERRVLRLCIRALASGSINCAGDRPSVGMYVPPTSSRVFIPNEEGSPANLVLLTTHIVSLHKGCCKVSVALTTRP